MKEIVITVGPGCDFETLEAALASIQNADKGFQIEVKDEGA